MISRHRQTPQKSSPSKLFGSNCKCALGTQTGVKHASNRGGNWIKNIWPVQGNENQRTLLYGPGLFQQFSRNENCIRASLLGTKSILSVPNACFKPFAFQDYRGKQLISHGQKGNRTIIVTQSGITFLKIVLTQDSCPCAGTCGPSHAKLHNATAHPQAGEPSVQIVCQNPAGTRSGPYAICGFNSQRRSWLPPLL